MAAFSIILSGVLATTVLACGASMGARGVDPDADRASIVVTNENSQDVRIFIELGSTSYPLGRVLAFQRRTFRLPPGLSRSIVRLRIQPFGGRRSFTTAEVALDTQTHIELWVAHQLNASRILTR